MRQAALLILLFSALTLAIPMGAAQLWNLPAQPSLLEPAASLSSSVPPPVSSASAPSAAAAARQTRGRSHFTILNRTTGKVEKVAALDYIRGAVASEMPATFHAEALTAQAVAAHTWALYSAGMQELYPDEALLGADFSADPSRDEGYITEERFFERYGAAATLYWPKICSAADIAVQTILTYQGEPALTAYHSTSAGATEAAQNVWAASLPYLVSVESEGDRLAPQFSVTQTFSRQEVLELLQKAFPDADFSNLEPGGWMVPLERSDAGYILLAEVGGAQVHGQELRNALGLRSSCLSIDYTGGQFVIESKGYGHGVGLSQYGADFMARQGADYAEILAHYYPGTALSAVSV